jgi:hypothetical protein
MDIPIPPLTLLDAIQFTADAWNRVEASTIESCWQSTGIIRPSADSVEEFLHLPAFDTEVEDTAVQHLIDRLHPQDPLTASEYLGIDSALQIEDKLDDDAIISLVQGIETVEEEEVLETAAAKITSAEAVELIDKLTGFLMHDETQVDVSNQCLSDLKSVKRTLCRMIMNSKSQTDIASFLDPID